MKKFLVALVVSMLVISSISVMAAESPTAQKYYKITVDGSYLGKDGNGSIKRPGGKISITSGKVSDGRKIVLKATPDNSYQFSKWIIEGSYTIVSGSLTSDNLVIISKGDIDIDAIFVDSNGNEVTESPTKPADDSSTSPKTGIATTAMSITIIMLLAGAVAIFIRKKAF